MGDNSFRAKFVQSAVVGVAPFALMFVAGHPFDLMKTRMQATMNQKSALVIANDLYKSQGLRGFYKAGTTNFARGLLKEGYRNPLRGYFYHVYSHNLPGQLQSKHPDLRNLLTGVTMSSVDVLIACPLERLKVWLMTNMKRKHESVFAYFAKSSNRPDNASLLRDLFRGINVSFYRSTVSWCSYLVVEERIRHFVVLQGARIRGIKAPGENTLVIDQIIIGFLCGLCNSAITLPLDTVKTHLQKREFATSEFKVKTDESFYRIIKTIYDTSGLKGLYAGWQFRLPHYVIIGLITSSNIQRINKIWEKS